MGMITISDQRPMAIAELQRNAFRLVEFCAVVLLVMGTIFCDAFATENDTFEIETEGRYQMANDTSVELSKKVALFNAQRTAVALAGRYFSRKSLIAPFELNRDEIYSLTAREIKTVVLEEKMVTAGNTGIYLLRINARVQVADFIKAEIEEAKLIKKEAEESYREEMEQHLAAEIDPGKDIAKAYLLLREKKWRITAIYLNHMAKKYPNWDSVYMIKAILHFILDEPVFMKKALNQACRLGNKTACDDLKKIKKLQEHDFGLSTTWLHSAWMR